MTCILLLLNICWSSSGNAAAEKGILPQSLILSLQIEEVFEYKCPKSGQCQFSCGSSVNDNLTFQNVKHLEVAKGKSHWAFAVLHMDSLGKTHETSGFIPEPASCVFEDLQYMVRIPVVDGVYRRATEEVIFDMSPSN